MAFINPIMHLITITQLNFLSIAIISGVLIKLNLNHLSF